MLPPVFLTGWQWKLLIRSLDPCCADFRVYCWVFSWFGRTDTLDQMRPSSPRYIGQRAILAFVAAGIISTLGLFLYYFAIRLGGVIITIPVQETYVIWGTLIAWVFLRERIHRHALLGVAFIFGGLVALSLGTLGGQPISPRWYWAIPLAFTTALAYGVSGVLWRDGQLRGAHQSTAIFLQFATSVVVGLGGCCWWSPDWFSTGQRGEVWRRC